MFNSAQARDAIGRWGSGGASYVKSQMTAENAKLAVTLGIRKALYLTANFDDPMMEVVEPVIHDMVHNAAQHLQVASSTARNAARAAVVAMMLRAG